MRCEQKQKTQTNNDNIDQWLVHDDFCGYYIVTLQQNQLYQCKLTEKSDNSELKQQHTRDLN